MKLAQNLPMHQEVVSGAPGLGHMRRAMTLEDMTDGGIAQRIQEAVQRGFISQEAASYLLDNPMGEGNEIARQLRMLSGPSAMPAVSDTVPYGMRMNMGEE
jgi:hypothetical protein